MRHTSRLLVAFAGALALCAGSFVGMSSAGASGKGASSSHSSHSAKASGGFVGCMVTDTGGIDDRSFNASSWAGMLAAKKADSKITVKYLQSKSTSTYVPNINAFVGEKCGIIVTVGFLMGTATEAAAKAHTTQKFAIVDYTYTPPLTNIDALVFNTVQDGFLGGYLAAGMSKSGKVATYGGQKLPTVTIYMDGFWDGVEYYNSHHHTHVQVLGWTEKSQNGSFTGTFTNQTKGATLTKQFIAEGADIIFPVAGNVGLGSAKAVQQADAAGGKVNMFWVDTDGCVSASTYCKYFITSVTKGIVSAVKAAVVSAAKGTYKGGNYIGNLKNGGVVLAPFHQFTKRVPKKLKNELKQVERGIISGKIKTPTKSPV